MISITISAFGISLKAYSDNQNNGGDFQDNSIYNALYLCWRNSKQIHDGNHFTRHKAPVRSLASLSSRHILFSGDETGKITMTRNDNGILKKVVVGKKTPDLFAGAEIRSLAVNPGGSYLLAVSLNDARVFDLKKLILSSQDLQYLSRDLESMVLFWMIRLL
jgi:hypothetical protein